MAQIIEKLSDLETLMELISDFHKEHFNVIAQSTIAFVSVDVLDKFRGKYACTFGIQKSGNIKYLAISINYKGTHFTITSVAY